MTAVPQINTPPLAGKTAVVTGGSSGIGAACARLLAEQGATVVIGFNKGEAQAEELRRELPGSGHRILHIPLTDIPAHERVAAFLKEAFGTVDILVNSAGFTKRIAHSNLEEMDYACFVDILNANVAGHFSIIRALMPLLRASGNATVVNVSSVSAFTGSGSNIAYCAAKGALDTMTISLARAFAPKVRFLCVSPAAVDTGFVQGRDHAELEKRAQGTPLGRIVTPEDVALAVLACITHLRTAVGARIVIDGGNSL